MNRCTINDIAKTIGSGITPLRSNMAFWENPKFPWLKTEQLGEFQIFDTTEYISQVALDETNIRLWPPQTLSVAMYGEGKTRGNVSIIMREMATNQACCNIIVDESVADYRYIYYWLKSNYNQLRALSSGVRKNLNSDDIKGFPVSLPGLPSKQKKLVDGIFTIDKKIELNKRIITELESMAKTIYDYWFVQFDFPNAEGKPYRSSGGEMVWNEQLKREIPKEWEVTTLSTKGEFKNGINYNKGSIQECTVKIINVRDISSSSSVLLSETLDSISLEADEISKYLVDKNDILIARSGIPGATRIMPPDTSETIYCGFIIRYRVIDAITKPYLFFTIKQFEQASLSQSGGTILKNISQDTLKDTLIVMPDNSTLMAFDRQIKPIFDMQYAKSRENFELINLRDWLLPMLMNGQVTVK